MSGLNKSLTSRHIKLIGLGSAIGVGLFLGSATSIQLTGPSIILAYLFGGFITFMVLRALGEMTVHDPAEGSFSYYANKYVSPFSGYMIGWGYWIYTSSIIVAQTTATSMFMGFWMPDVPQWIWASSALALMTFINLFSVKYYGEFEFWFAIIKVITMVIFIIVGMAFIVTGLGNDGVPIGMSHLWSHGGWFPNGIEGFLWAMPMVLYSYAGIEMIGLTAAEAKEPKKIIPRVVNAISWQIVVFYCGAMFVILSIFPWNEVNGQMSPFVLMFERLGLREVAAILNFVVITASLSACNAAIFSSGRLLLGLARSRQAPVVFRFISNQGVPSVAIIASASLALASVALNYYLPGRAFEVATSAVTLIGVLAWLMILITQLRFRKKMGEASSQDLTFKMPFYPYGSYLAILSILGIIVSLALSERTVIAFYITAPLAIIFATLYFVLNLHQPRELVKK